MGILQAAVRRRIGPPPTLNYPGDTKLQVGVAYSNSAVVTLGRSPFSFSRPSGTFPTGINVNSTSGLVSGTPTGGNGASYNGTPFSVTTRVTDADSQFADFLHSLFVFQAPAVLSDGSQTSFTGTAGNRGLRLQGVFSSALIDRINNGSASRLGQWYGPLAGVSFSESDYEVRGTVLAGTLAGGSSANATWLSLINTCQWTSNANGFQLFIEIRNATTLIGSSATYVFD